jgi:hypothetical protein
VVALLLIPSGVAVAAALKYTGIEGTNGITTTENKAGVATTGQLRVAEADPNALYQSGQMYPGGTFRPVATPPSGSALILTYVHVDTFSDPTPGSGQNVTLFVETGTSCSGSVVGSYFGLVNPGADGQIDVPLTPGLAVPSGDSFCGEDGGSVETDLSASGYIVPAADVTAGALHAASTFKQ